MASKTTSTSGFTLTEMLISSGVASMVLVILGVVTIQTTYGMRALVNYSSFEQDSRQALDQLSREIRQAYQLTAANRTNITLDITNGPISYTYNSGTKTLQRQAPNGTKILLRDCTEFEFTLFQRSPTVATYDQFPVGSGSATKLVQISWTCALTNADGTINTTDSQSSKVVIRKQ